MDNFQSKVRIEIPVQWGDMDAAQHVNNVKYLRWVESGRLAYFEALGMDMSFVDNVAGPILGYQDCKYIYPLYYPDTAIIAIKTSEILEDRIIMETRIYSKTHHKLSAISTQSIVPYDFVNKRKIALPKEWKQAIEQLEKY